MKQHFEYTSCKNHIPWFTFIEALEVIDKETDKTYASHLLDMNTNTGDNPYYCLLVYDYIKQYVPDIIPYPNDRVVRHEC